MNRDYGLVRGGTIALAMRPVGMLLSSSLDLTYSDAQGSSSDPNAVATVLTAGGSGESGDFYLDRSLVPLDWDQTFTANASATLGRARSWNVGAVLQLASGLPYTPAFLDPTVQVPTQELRNTERRPLQFTFDLSAEKHLRLGGTSLGLRVQVENVFNQLNETSVNAITGRAGPDVRLPTVQADRDLVRETVGLFTYDEAELQPGRYSAPRRVLFGLTLTL